jgi:hypothetical protein
VTNFLYQQKLLSSLNCKDESCPSLALPRPRRKIKRQSIKEVTEMIQPASLIAEYDQIAIGKENMHHRRESQLPRLEILFFSSSCFIDGV